MSIIKTYSRSIASGDTASSQFTMQAGYTKLYLDLPAFSTATTAYLQASIDGTTFRRIYRDQAVPITSSDQYEISSTVVSGLVEAPAGFNYYIIETQDTIDDGATVGMVALYEN